MILDTQVSKNLSRYIYIQIHPKIYRYLIEENRSFRVYPPSTSTLLLHQGRIREREDII